MAQPSRQAELTYLTRIIESARLFRPAPPDDIAELARCARGFAVPQGKPIAPPRGKDEEIYAIASGAGGLLGSGAGGEKSLLVAVMGPGDVIGLAKAVAKLSGGVAADMGDWRALSNMTLVAIPSADFVRIMRRSDELTSATVTALARMVEQMVLRFSAEMQNPLEKRLAGFLERLGAIAAGNRWEPTANVGRFQQTQIAEMLGVSREHINRTLTMWEKSGLIFQTKGGEIIVENRKRLAQMAGAGKSRGGESGENDWLWEIEANFNYGLNAAAYDLAIEGVKRTPKDERFKYQAVLAMARMGALAEALSQAEAFKLTGSSKNQDIACIGPRLRRDLAFAHLDGPDKAQLKRAAEGFERVFKDLNTTYPGVNAAATYAMSGDLDRARKLATKVSAAAAAAIEEIDDDEPAYWSRATLAECRLITGDAAGAAAEFAAAARAADAAPGKIATTRKQLKRLRSAIGIDDAWIDRTLPIGSILYFCGPLTPAVGEGQPAIEGLKKKFTSFLGEHQFVSAIGALAAGADIVLAEILLDAGIPLHAHLPLSPTEFMNSSVAPAGGAWRERYIACIERAHTIDWIRRAKPSRAAYRLGARFAIGRAIRQAEELATRPTGFIAVQRGRTAQNSVSVENAKLWRALGLNAEIVEDDWLLSSSNLASELGQSYLAALVVQGAEKGAVAGILGDLPIYSQDINGLSLFAFERVSDALKGARRLRDEPAAKSLRIWLDAGVGERDAAKSAAFASMLITASCKPQTAPGKIYASEIFVYATISTPDLHAHFEYTGYAPTEEKLDPCPLYLVQI